MYSGSAPSVKASCHHCECASHSAAFSFGVLAVTSLPPFSARAPTSPWILVYTAVATVSGSHDRS